MDKLAICESGLNHVLVFFFVEFHKCIFWSKCYRFCNCFIKILESLILVNIARCQIPMKLPKIFSIFAYLHIPP